MRKATAEADKVKDIQEPGFQDERRAKDKRERTKEKKADKEKPRS